MANHEHVAALKSGVDEWNNWRNKQGDLRPDLSAMSLINEYLYGANLSWCDLSGTDLSGATLIRAKLLGASLSQAKFICADLTSADVQLALLTGAEAIDARFCSANLSGARLNGADLRGADFQNASLTGAHVDNADFCGCRVYGVSAWSLKGVPRDQTGLVITKSLEPIITVDDLEVAQFIYLLLNNQKIRHVIDTITSKVVLILGRFTPERKAVLDALRDELRKRDYVPVLFDFEKPSTKTTIETVSTLAHMARFVIADLTDAKSVLQELQAVVPTNPSVPIQPLILNSQTEPGMFDFFRMYHWVLEPYLYDDQDRLLAALNDNVIGPAEAKAKEQTGTSKP
jgi:uncharacterized protein YjbI with pentapeptide repeats